MKGESFRNREGKEREAKAIGQPCTSEFCRKSTLRSCQSLSDEQRQGIFDRFWSMKTWEERRSYVHALVNSVDIKQKSSQASRRSASRLYHLKLPDAASVPVCKSLFCATLGLSKRTVSSWLDVNDQNPPKPKSPKTGKCVPVGANDLNFLKNWLNGLPTVPSHYCRNVPAYQSKKFVYPGATKANLHAEYTAAATEANARVVGLKYFSNVFEDEKFSVFIPRKDQCDICVSAKHGNLNQDILDKHVQAKDEARAEKAKDKAAASDKISVWTMDMQSVLLCPKTKASSLYYKTKLQVHNFTLYNLGTKDGYCYAWDEAEGNLSSEVFAHIQTAHFTEILRAKPTIEKIIIWSDGCGYQNRNTTVANAYIDLAMKHNVTIEQKYLVAGHTQMECDSMHSTIERRIVSDIFTPRDYIVIFENARIRPAPYHVRQLSHDEMMKLSGTYVTSIRPGKKAGDPTVHNLRALRYPCTGRVEYKITFSEEAIWEPLPQRISIPTQPLTWSRIFQGQQPIPLRKFNDLQAMKPVMPQCVHNFFDSLPHE